MNPGLMEDPVDHFVKYDRLPEGYQIPSDLREKFRFDAENHRLIFSGYMSKTEFDRICEPTRDWAFRRSVEELFRMSVDDAQPNPAAPRRGGLLSRLFARG